MMSIEVDNRYLRERSSQDLRPNGCIVEETEPGGSIRIRVVPWRAAERKGVITRQHRLGTRNGTLGGPIGCPKGAHHHRTGQVTQVPSGLAQNADRARPVPGVKAGSCTSVGMYIWQNLRT